MEFHKAQQLIALDNHRFRVVRAGRRFGKSIEASEEIKGKAYRINSFNGGGSRIAYIAPTYQQARDIMWNILKEELRPIAIKINESRLEIEVRNQNGSSSFIILRGWESIDTLRGQSFDFIVIDEIAMMRNFWINYEEVIRPTLSDRKGEILFISTPKGYNHFYDLYNKELNDPSYKSFHFTTYDNPFIDKEEIEDAKREMTPDRFAQEYMAEFTKQEGLVYKEFNRALHLFDNPPENIKETVLGIDFGFTNPACILKILVDYDDNLWVVEEWYHRGRTTDEIGDIALSYESNKVYADPAEPDRIEELRKRGLNIREVSKDITAGIDKVRERLKNRTLRIHKSCLNLIGELESYVYPEENQDRNQEEKPIKMNDHSLDALRYVVFNYKGNNMQDLYRVESNRRTNDSIE